MPRLLALFENIIPDWKWLKVTNSFAEHETELIKAIKSFIVQGNSYFTIVSQNSLGIEVI
jgi:hypothetical protein